MAMLNNQRVTSVNKSKQSLQLQTPSETVFGVIFLGLNT